jgi:hypothetical protein
LVPLAVLPTLRLTAADGWLSAHAPLGDGMCVELVEEEGAHRLAHQRADSLALKGSSEPGEGVPERFHDSTDERDK